MLQNRVWNCAKPTLRSSHAISVWDKGKTFHPFFSWFSWMVLSHIETYNDGLPVFSRELSLRDDLIRFGNLFTLLYADDTIIMAESVNALQSTLNGTFEHYNRNKLQVLTTKTKIVVFWRGKTRNVSQISFGGEKTYVTFKYFHDTNSKIFTLSNNWFDRDRQT